MHLKMPSTKWWPFCLSLNVLTLWDLDKMTIENETKFADIVSFVFSWLKFFKFDITQIFQGLTDDKSTLVPVMTWYLTSSKPFPETMMIK